MQDELTGTLSVTATQREHERIIDLLDRLDSVPSTGQRPMRTFIVRNRDVLEVKDVLQEMVDNVLLSPLAGPERGSGTPSAAVSVGGSSTPKQSAEDPDLVPGIGTAVGAGIEAVNAGVDVSQGELGEALTRGLAAAGGHALGKGMQALKGADESLEAAGATVYRQGTFADESIGWKGNHIKGRQWATDNPLTTPDFAQKYGLPAENTGTPDWVVGGRTQGPYTTRPAPPSHNNPRNAGGGTEILPRNPNDIQIDWFHMPD